MRNQINTSKLWVTNHSTTNSSNTKKDKEGRKNNHLIDVNLDDGYLFY